ncbi:Glycosyl hydrolase 108 [Hymenobacter daecheongensis DSM 21074]|uniref:Glycosyl hydrolase 108 n=1 Tax=Hymenobacter daecheongensis DSM 21074 TaxID=1121955 RepID=A0A1M6I2T2_9BACT|nr:glycosyl hydrolase 108 family protein [Hymenobacter daecheongensis]SHJ28762.1 Glycosyl hydrolase 108 [Hymenobacter daecheongensis DSM 21074]
MADFTAYFQILRANEGGYCNRPDDSGGETYRGIARKKNPQWNGWALVDATKARLYGRGLVPATDWLPLSHTLEADPAIGDRVLAFYKPQYWDTLGLDQLTSQSVADQIADHGVNAGVGRAARMVQQLLNTEFGCSLPTNGQQIPQTVAALNAVDARTFYGHFVAMRQAFYHYLAASLAPAPGPELAAWYQFFAVDLGLPRNPNLNHDLDSWLSRTQVPFTA